MCVCMYVCIYKYIYVCMGSLTTDRNLTTPPKGKQLGKKLRKLFSSRGKGKTLGSH